MPRLMRSTDDIMSDRGRDTLLLRFPGLMWGGRSDAGEAARVEHFEWLVEHGITWEPAAPEGWLEGDPAIYHLYVETDDPRIALYSSAYENEDGSSLQASAYEMGIMEYGPWLERHPDADGSR
jgi:hypothetical protein